MAFQLNYPDANKISITAGKNVALPRGYLHTTFTIQYYCRSLSSFTLQVFEFCTELILKLSARFVLFRITRKRQLESSWRINTLIALLLYNCTELHFSTYSLNCIKNSSLSKSERHMDNFDVLQNETAGLSFVSIYLAGILLFTAVKFGHEISSARLCCDIIRIGVISTLPKFD